ncbi:MAG: pilus assembly protein N-terminal domain-containing protein, partial [Pseudomonadota bacterium]
MRMIMSAAASLLALLSSAQAGQVWLTMDHVRPYQLERPASNIVIGNPAIADVTVQDSENILLFGKAPGMTNIVITDDAGKTIENMIIRVRSSSDMLTYFRGSSRMT